MSAVRAGRSRKRGTPVSIGDAMQSLVKALGVGPKLAEYDIIIAWPDVVGPQIARVTSPQRVENGVLFVEVTSAPWRAELTMKRLELIAKLNTHIGTRILNDIRFR